MARPFPGLPHPSVPAVEDSRLLARQFRDLLAEMLRRVPVIGSATFVSATTIAVTLATPETDNSYRVLIEGAAARSYWPSSKTTTGFTINASASNSDTVGWALLRT